MFSWAASIGSNHLVDIYVKRTNNGPDHIDQYGKTALIWAAINGHASMVEGLLRRFEASPSKCDVDGTSPLYWAARCGRSEVLEILLETLVQRGDTQLGLCDEEDPNHTLLLTAASRGHNKALFRELSEKNSDLDAESHNLWLSEWLFKAVELKSSSLVEVVLQDEAEVDCLKDKMTPLCVAAENGSRDIVDLLLARGADPDSLLAANRVIIIAINNTREDVVRLLLDAGADITASNKKGESALTLAEKYPTILSMVLQQKEYGKLAQKSDLDDAIDELFEARVVKFLQNSGSLKPLTSHLPVSHLLGSSGAELESASDFSKGICFTWFHLPANNMSWVEALVASLQRNQSVTYKIFHPTRWAGRQHHGPENVHHARFMRPLCQAFTARSSSTAELLTSAGSPNLDHANASGTDQDMVLFMPFLHWEEARRIHMWKGVPSSESTAPSEQSGSSRYAKLVKAYALKQGLHPAHRLHVRRTLDQFYYHSLKDTDIRDKSQVVTRYQQGLGKEPEVLAMVDQLWLWVLVGESGRADTIITCFPTPHKTKKSSAQGKSNHENPDSSGVTDVVQNIIVDLVSQTQLVETPYDLAGVIASQCSRIFLNPSAAARALQFSEVYSSAIGDVANRETELFKSLSDTFRQKRRKIPEQEQKNLDAALKALDNIDDKNYQTLQVRDTYQQWADQLLSLREIPSLASIESMIGGDKIDVVRLKDTVRRVGHFYEQFDELDISEEITLLHEIKDVQDELTIMGKVFQEQKNVLGTMENLIHSSSTPNNDVTEQTNTDGLSQPDLAETPSDPSHLQSNAKVSTQDSSVRETDPSGAGGWTAHQQEPERNWLGGAMQSIVPFLSILQFSTEPETAQVEASVTKGEAPNAEDSILVTDEENTTDDIGQDNSDHSKINEVALSKKQDSLSYRQRRTKNSTHSQVWRSSMDSNRRSLPLQTVQQNIDEIEWMTQRASDTIRSLDALVDLKQKQSNVLEARSARTQAELSLKATKAAQIQAAQSLELTRITNLQAERSLELTLASQEQAKATAKQSKILMTFTIVTIVFLPLGFMASFFTIELAEFKRNKDDKMSLGYVSGILFPISMTASALLIAIAFHAKLVDGLKDVNRFMSKHWPAWMPVLTWPENVKGRPGMEKETGGAEETGPPKNAKEIENRQEQTKKDNTGQGRDADRIEALTGVVIESSGGAQTSGVDSSGKGTVIVQRG
ncbi:hypothetical protein QBC44DRAFT_297910 [Cladorrhinum sp. PSN332]|nr:hypothetical protein QBC44DRAFT_297910 [Cladorrhinum sp. PSN332]